MAGLPLDRHTQTLGLHTLDRRERVSYTPIDKWWTFRADMGRWSKCFSWVIG